MTGHGPLSRWIRDISIAKKLITIVVSYVAIIATVLLVVAFSSKVVAGVRSYVVAEGLWSKGQKDAVYYLTVYARSREDSDYRKYLRAISAPLGYHKARLELQKASYNYQVAEQGFIEGGNTPVDAADMIFLYRWFHEVSYLKQAIGYWREGDGFLVQLVQCAEDLRALTAAGDLTPESSNQLLDRIETINTGVTPLEHKFSATLGEGARWIQNVLVLLIFSTALVLLAAGLYVSWLISREVNLRIQGLREGTTRVSGGDLDHIIEVQSRDELGELARAFNDMVMHRRGVEESLREATQFREKVMQSTSNAIYALDLQRRFTLVNQRTCEMTGYTQEELLGISYQTLYTSQVVGGVDRQFDFVASGAGQVSNFETPLVRRDGSHITITFSIVPLMKDDRIVGVVGTAEDITERKRAESELAARAAELASSNAELEQFAHVASHDLQAPLRGIIGFSQLLEQNYKDRLDKDANEYIQLIVQSATRMRSLITDLLTFSRVGKHGTETGPVACEEVLAQVEGQLSSLIESRHAKVVHDPLPVVTATELEIGQLLQNLVSNGIKYQPGDNPVVHISARHSDGSWLFSVRDYGIGIKPEHQARIFQIFQRLHTADEFEGTGIGLAICKKIVDRYGGRIWVESEEDAAGSTFCFTIPDNARRQA